MDRFVVDARERAFSHKLECEKFIQRAQAEADKRQDGFEGIDEVFYSQGKNSCLLARHIDYIPGKTSPGYDAKYEIDDVLEDTVLWSQSAVGQSARDRASQQMDQKIQELR
jgi:hypothetical protein